MVRPLIEPYLTFVLKDEFMSETKRVSGQKENHKVIVR